MFKPLQTLTTVAALVHIQKRLSVLDHPHINRFCDIKFTRKTAQNIVLALIIALSPVSTSPELICDCCTELAIMVVGTLEFKCRRSVATIGLCSCAIRTGARFASRVGIRSSLAVG